MTPTPRINPAVLPQADVRRAATETVRLLALAGHGRDFIVSALNQAGLPTLSGRKGARWNSWDVEKLAKEAGVQVRFRRGGGAPAALPPTTSRSPEEP